MKEITPIFRRFKERSRRAKPANGFNILEIVIGVGLILTLSAGGVVSFGGVTENAIAAKAQEVSSSVYKLAMYYALDNDPNTNPEDAARDYNNSTSDFRVTVKHTLNSGGIEIVRTALKTSVNPAEDLNQFKKKMSGVARGGGGGRVPTMIMPAQPTDLNNDYCVTATWLKTDRKVTSYSGICNTDDKLPDDSEKPEEPDTPGETEPPVEPPIETPAPTEPPLPTTPPEPTEPPKPTEPPAPVEKATTFFDVAAKDPYSVTLRWRPVDGFDKYILERSSTLDFSNVTQIEAEKIGSSEFTTFKDTGLATNADYFYRVKVSPGVSNKWSSTVSVRTPSDALIATFDTRLCGGNIVLPVSEVVGQGSVDWGDGTSSPLGNNMSHIYRDTKGLKTVKVYGSFSRWVYESKSWGNECLTSIDDWGLSKINIMQQGFYGAKNLVSLAAPPTTVTNMSSLFKDAENFNQPINDWDVSNVKDMSFMFQSAKKFNQPLDQWDTSNLTNVSGMFYSATAFNQPLEDWSISKLTSIFAMFDGASSFNQPLAKWDTSKITNMGQTFQRTTSMLQDLSSWNVSKVTTKTYFSTSSKMLTKPEYLPKFK